MAGLDGARYTRCARQRGSCSAGTSASRHKGAECHASPCRAATAAARSCHLSMLLSHSPMTPSTQLPGLLQLLHYESQPPTSGPIRPLAHTRPHTHLGRAQRLVQHDTRVRQRLALPLVPRAQQQGGHGGGLAHTHGADRAADVLQGQQQGAGRRQRVEMTTGRMGRTANRSGRVGSEGFWVV